MQVRTYQNGNTASTAVYSDCMAYRYSLTRVWGPGPRWAYVMLNPSTATEVQNDPTIERCERRARAMGCGAFRVVNLFAFRATDPKVLVQQVQPIGADNDTALHEAAAWADQVLCGWGMHGGLMKQGERVAALLRSTGKPLLHLGLTKVGHPRHPLYIGYAVRPQVWT